MTETRSFWQKLGTFIAGTAAVLTIGSAGYCVKVQSLEDKVEELRNQNRSLEEQLDTTSTALPQAEVTCGPEIESLTKQLTSCQGNESSLRGKVRNLEAQLASAMKQSEGNTRARTDSQIFPSERKVPKDLRSFLSGLNATETAIAHKPSSAADFSTETCWEVSSRGGKVHALDFFFKGEACLSRIGIYTPKDTPNRRIQRVALVYSDQHREELNLRGLWEWEYVDLEPRTTDTLRLEILSATVADYPRLEVCEVALISEC